MNVYDKQYIDGKWVEGSGTVILEDRNPLTNELLYTYRSAGPEDVDAAYRAAEKAQKMWETFLPAQKQAVFEKAINNMIAMEDEIHTVLCEEGGFIKPKREFEYDTCIAFLKTCMKFPEMMTGKIAPSNIPGKENYVFRVPKGVICVIAPWNVPLVLAMRSVVPALAAGNAIVLKPASDTPATASLVAKIFENTGMPDGLLNILTGAGSQIGDEIVQHPIPRLVSFTGSTSVGRHIGEVAGRMLKEVSLELGGNNAMLVLKDANIEDAAAAAVFGSFFNQGQVCMALNRIIVEDEVYDQFTESFIKKVKNLKIGDPKDDEVFVGPIISASQRDSVQKLVDTSIQEGAKIALEGKTNGNLMSPWILTDVTNDMETACNEVFGPVISIIRAKDEADAISISNDTEYGLSGSVFTKDLYHGIQVAQKLDTGMVHINDQSINDEPHVMFGGVKNSGIGRFNDEWVLEKFTTDRWISVQTQARF